MGANQSGSFNTDLASYKVIQKIPQHSITYLSHFQTEKQYLLRQLTFNDQNIYKKNLQQLQKRKSIQNQHLTHLGRVQGKTIDHLCSNVHKIYAMWQYPQRYLSSEINQRALQRRKFQEKQLWSILASLILGMSTLQKNKIKHQCLNTKNILLDNQGLVKVADPLAAGTTTNIDLIYNNRHARSIYLSPEQCESLQVRSVYSNPYKNDVWSMGMILLQCGLLQRQDDCYKDQYQRIDSQLLRKNIRRFGLQYSQELRIITELMLKKDNKDRPDWLDLQQYARKSTDKSQIINQSNQKIQRVDTKSFSPIYKYDNTHKPSTSLQSVPNQQQFKRQSIQKNINNLNLGSFNTSTQKLQPLKNQLYTQQPQSNRAQTIPLPHTIINQTHIQQQPQSNRAQTIPLPQTIVNQTHTQLQPQTLKNQTYIQQPQIVKNQPYIQQQTQPLQQTISPLAYNSVNRNTQIVFAAIPQYAPQNYHLSYQPVSSYSNNYQQTKRENISPSKVYTNQQIPQQNYVVSNTGYLFSNPNTVQQPSIHTHQKSLSSHNIAQSYKVVQPTLHTNNLSSPPQTFPKTSQNNNLTPNIQTLNQTPPQTQTQTQNQYQATQVPNYTSIQTNQKETITQPKIESQFKSFGKTVNNEAAYKPIDLNIQNQVPITTSEIQFASQKSPTKDSQFVIETFKQGSRYEGYKLHDMRHGQGKFYYQDGGMYDGTWNKNKMDGFGSLYYQSGALAYQGMWKSDQFQGKGKLFNESSQKLNGLFDYTNFDEIDEYWEYYQGDFLEDMKKGKGKLLLSNGQYFIGTFQNDMVEGPGQFYRKDGSIISGQWQSNQYISS